MTTEPNTRDDERPDQAYHDMRRQRDAIAAVLATREAELLSAFGRCSNRRCRLHLTHSGPCGIRPGAERPAASDPSPRDDKETMGAPV